MKKLLLLKCWLCSIGKCLRQDSSIPGCGKLFALARGVPEVLNLQMLRDLDEIITKRPSPPVNFKSWLETRRANYQAWLARL